jgi:hypothetical protein
MSLRCDLDLEKESVIRYDGIKSREGNGITY